MVFKDHVQCLDQNTCFTLTPERYCELGRDGELKGEILQKQFSPESVVRVTGLCFFAELAVKVGLS